MRTLLVYASRKGAAMECARYIQKGIKEETTVIDLTKEQPTNLSAYDKIIMGSSIYAGNMRSELKKFIANNNDTLPNKKVFLFLSCLDSSKKEDYLGTIFTEEEKKQLISCACCGGILAMNKLNFIERALMKKIMKDEKDEQGNPLVLNKDTVVSRLDYKVMDEFIANVNETE